MDMTAEGVLWSPVIVSHRSTGRLSDREMTNAQAIRSHIRLFLITCQAHVKQAGIWEWQSSRNDWNSLIGLMRWTDLREYLHSNWNMFYSLGLFSKAKNKFGEEDSRLPGCIKKLTCNAKNKQETFFPHSGKKKLRKKSMFQRLKSED